VNTCTATILAPNSLHAAALAWSIAAVVVPVPGPLAYADPGDQAWALNGVYSVLSNGDWARTNEVYHDETSVRSTWTITTACSNAMTCSGTVRSDQGWSAAIHSGSGEYVVKRDVPNWEPCPDGAFATGHQVFQFYPVDDRGMVSIGSSTLAGYDVTTSDSGSCAINKDLQIALPLRLEKIR
jgi:hypothetical protein